MRLILAVSMYNEVEYGPHVRVQLDDALEMNCYDQIVVLDDGSTDGTWDVLQEYRRKHNNIHIFRNEKNSILNHGENKFKTLYDKVETFGPDWIQVRAADVIFSDPAKNLYRKTILELDDKGVNFIGLGIESVNKKVRQNVSKGKFADLKIEEVIRNIENAGIEVGANYIFGLPEDTHESMQETLDFALSNQTAMVNMYSTMAYPGSKLYLDCIKHNPSLLPSTYSGYSQHSYDCYPLRSKYLSSKEILQFRDYAWMKYHTDPTYLKMVQEKFGQKAYNNTVDSTKIKLRRKILGD